MKKSIQAILLVFLLGIIYSGCEKTKSLLDVKFDAKFETNVPVVVEPADLKKTLYGVFYASATIDPMSNSDFAEYADKIKDISIKSVTAEVISISKPAVLLSADLTISSEGVSPAAWSFSNENLEVGKTLTLDNGAGQWSRVQTMLNNKKLITVVIEGSTDEDNLTFTLKVTINTEVTANPL
jgi:hypothetical protein